MPLRDAAAKLAYDVEYKRRRYAEDSDFAERQRKAVRQTHKARRVEVFEEYGGRCACCGETEQRFLCVDHIFGNGSRHRRDNGLTGSYSFYAWLKYNCWPKGFQILCYNCNNAKAQGGCPHNEIDIGA